MENIKTNIEKLMDKLNESLTHSAPNKLSFGDLTTSLENFDSLPKKRCLSPDIEITAMETTAQTSLNDTSLNSTETATTTTTIGNVIPCSPWQIRRMKADLLESNCLRTKLKDEIRLLQKQKAEMEIIYENKVTELKKQCDFTCNKVLDLESHMDAIRKRDHKSRIDLIKMERKYNELKLKHEQEIHQIQHKKIEAEMNLQQIQNSHSNEISEHQRIIEKLQMDLELTNDELSNTKNLLEKQKERADMFDSLKHKHEQLEVELASAKSHINKLDFDIESYKDFKNITDTCKNRLSDMIDKEKQLGYLKTQNKNLHEIIGNKLLMEEKLHNLQTRVELDEGARAEASTLQVKLTYIEQELKEWVKIAQDHCPPNSLVSPIALRARIEELLQHDIINAAEKNNKLTDTHSKETELLELKHRCEVYAKNVEELNIALKRHKTFKERVQKKLFLVSKERDYCKQLLENYEKDLTFSTMQSIEPSTTETHLRHRIDMLEKTLTGYKEMCANLEKELTQTKQTANNECAEEQQFSETTTQYMRNELVMLRTENERLRRRKDELELELEHRCLKGDFNVGKFKVVHLKNNPADEAYKATNDFVEKLQAEIERLKRRNKKLEEDNEINQTRLNETMNFTVNIKELNHLRAELESANAKVAKVKETYKAASMEYRDVCYMLFGYKVDRIDYSGRDPTYNVYSMYAESEDDYLSFILSDSSNLTLVETPYSNTIQPLIESLLTGDQSLPIFMSNLTMELYNRSTVTIS